VRVRKKSGEGITADLALATPFSPSFIVFSRRLAL
jgi:hypothetical protein